jgi:Uma2 family endonuclease
MVAIEQITTAEALLEATLQHCELLEGELIMMSPAGFNHGGIAGNIALALGAFVKPRSLGVVVTAEPGFQIAHNPDTVRVPDVAFVRADRIPSCGVKGFFQGAPDLAIEVISPSDRAVEVEAKSQEWLGAGCRAVWVVDPETRTVAVHSNSGVTVLSESETLTGGDVLPGFSVSVAEVFA